MVGVISSLVCGHRQWLTVCDSKRSSNILSYVELCLTARTTHLWQWTITIAHPCVGWLKVLVEKRYCGGPLMNSVNVVLSNIYNTAKNRTSSSLLLLPLTSEVLKYPSIRFLPTQFCIGWWTNWKITLEKTSTLSFQKQCPGYME